MYLYPVCNPGFLSGNLFTARALPVPVHSLRFSHVERVLYISTGWAGHMWMAFRQAG